MYAVSRVTVVACAGLIGAAPTGGSVSARPLAPPVLRASDANASATASVGSGRFLVSGLPAEFKPITDISVPLANGRRFTSTIYGRYTKREAVARHLDGFGPTVTITVWYNSTPKLPTAGYSSPLRVSEGLTVRSRPAWSATSDESRATILGWTERRGLDVQLGADGGISLNTLLVIAEALEEISR